MQRGRPCAACYVACRWAGCAPLQESPDPIVIGGANQPDGVWHERRRPCEPCGIQALEAEVIALSLVIRVLASGEQQREPFDSQPAVLRAVGSTLLARAGAAERLSPPCLRCRSGRVRPTARALASSRPHSARL